VPGYGYQLEKGATSLTESWKAEGASHNHMMLGHLMEWFYSGLGGIGQSENSVAYKEIVIKPEIVDDMSFVSTSYESPFGTIKCNWEKKDNVVKLTIDIPVNTRALVYLDKITNSEVSEGNSKINTAMGIEIVSETDEQIVCKVGSGTYSFRIDE
jgi:alpha-L-rhamnosidase